MQLSEIKVRPDWRQITEEKVAQSTRLWRIVQAAVVVSTLTTLLLMVFSRPGSWEGFFRLLVFPTLLFVLPLWYVYRPRDVQTLAVWDYVLLLGTGGLAYYAALLFMGQSSDRSVFLWSTPLSILIPFVSWPLLIWAYRRFPTPLRQLGLDVRDWQRNVLIGVAIGTTLGLHLLFVTNQMTQMTHPRVTVSVLIWTLFYQAGVGALGEELFFRGLGFHLLVDGMNQSFTQAAGRILFLNMLIYLIPASSTTNLITGLLVLAYGAVLILVTTYLRHHQHSLVACVACNVVFSVFLGIIIV